MKNVSKVFHNIVAGNNKVFVLHLLSDLTGGFYLCLTYIEYQISLTKLSKGCAFHKQQHLTLMIMISSIT